MSKPTYFNSGDVHIKLQFNSDYRRFFVQKSCKFSELAEKIKLILGLKDNNFIIKYKDEEEEWITISSDIELETGLIISNGALFRLQISLIGNKVEKECKTEKDDDKGCDPRPWMKYKKRCKKWKCREGKEETDEYRPRRFRGSRCRGRGRWRSWRNECNNEEECNDGTGEKKHWKRFRKERRRMRKFYDDCESSSDTNSGDALLSLEEIKKNMEKLKQDLGLLKEKSGSAKAEIKELRLKLKEKRRNGSSDFDGIFTLRNALKEKKQSWFQIFKEVKMTRYRIRKLHNLAETKTV